MSNIAAVKKPSIASFHMHTLIKKYIVINDPKSAMQRRIAIIFQVRANTLPPMWIFLNTHNKVGTAHATK